jgi:hypothetical protein
MKRLIKIIGLLILGVPGVIIKAIYLSTNNLYTLVGFAIALNAALWHLNQ